MKLSQIKPNPDNPRIIKEDKFKKLVQSIKDFPDMLEKRPIVIDEDNVVLGGNMRLRALQELKYKDVPVIVAKGWTEEQKREFVIKDNTGFGEWDWDILANEWSDNPLTEWGLDVWQPEFEPPEGLTDEDAVPEVPDDPVTVEGDVWLLGRHRLMCGDSTSIDAVERLMDGATIDLVHTDPPYGIGEKAGVRTSRETNSLAKSNSHLHEFNDETADAARDAFSLCDAMNIKRQVWWGANHYSHAVPETANWFVWDKRVEEKQKDVNSDCELAWVKSKWASVRIFRHLWKGLIKASEHGQKRIHPTQKPVALIEWVFDYYKDVSTVMDLFGGSGSTLIAAERQGKSCHMMEFEAHYCDVIIKRWEDFTGKKATLSK